MEYKRGDNIRFILSYLAQYPGAGTGEILFYMKKWRGLDMSRRTHTQYFTRTNYRQIGYSGAKERYIDVRWKSRGNGKWELTQAGMEELNKIGMIKL